jgi:hypothetical protein
MTASSALTPILAAGWGCAVDRLASGGYRATVYPGARQPVSREAADEAGAVRAVCAALGLSE